MNLICITESELSQWVSRRHFDTLTARILTDREEVTLDIFWTAPYLKLDDARGRIIVNLKENWKALSPRVKTANDVDAMSIPLDAIQEIAPAMDQYSKRLGSYNLPIAKWSVEKIWDTWLISQAVKETYRAIAYEKSRIGCVDKEFIKIGLNYLVKIKKNSKKFKNKLFRINNLKKVGYSINGLKFNNEILNVEKEKLRTCDCSVLSAILEHTDYPYKVLQNAFKTTRKIIILRTFIDLKKQNAIQVKNVKHPYNIRRFGFNSLKKIFSINI